MEHPENIAAILFFIGSAVSILMLVKIFYFYKVTIKRWNNTVGYIVSYETVPVDVGGWKKKVTFRYIVDGREYLSDSLTKNIRMLYTFEDDVEYEEKYSVGNEISVYYNPVKPQDCIVVAQFDYYSLFVLLFSILLFIVAYNSWE